jgi:hypothetical protein
MMIDDLRAPVPYYDKHAAASYFWKQALFDMKPAYDHYSGQVVQS